MPTAFDTARYLDRIGLADRALPLTAESLSLIIERHLSHIPFENLDAWVRHEAPDLTQSALFDKIILRRRGGWCFEQNALLEALLLALGFQVYPVGVRVVMGRDGRPAVSHRGEICVVDGRHYYCDVGFGNELFRAVVPMDGTVNPYGYFMRREGEYTALCKNPAAPERLLLFIDRPYEPSDYDYANFALAAMPGSPFREHLFVSILTPEGHRKLLFDRRLTETANGAVLAERELTGRADLAAVLAADFGIDYPLSD